MQHAKTSEIDIASDGSHHVVQGKPLYAHRFERVLAFHEPGIAPVLDSTGAYHITKNGEAAYSQRYLKTYGFYHDLAAVVDQSGCFHINPNGIALYPERYAWCGNFQQQRCVVKDKSNQYFHIDINGKACYSERYAYVGDYREGYSAVCNTHGVYNHIDKNGNLLHEKWFQDLDVYHKGFARAQDEAGWYHIDKKGRAAYKKRYAVVEPFYNDVAKVITFDGKIQTINHYGEVVDTIFQNSQDHIGELSGKLISFWTSETLFAAVELGVLDFMPDTTISIARQANLPEENVGRLLRALHEIDIVEPKSGSWHLTGIGNLLSGNQSFGVAAAKTWRDIHKKNWPQLKELLATSPKRHLSIKESCADKHLLETYHFALDGYTQKDFSLAVRAVDWISHKNVIACERTGLKFLTMLAHKYKHLNLIALGHPNNLGNNTHFDGVNCISHDLTKAWPKKADAICLTRTLHYWPDDDALSILENAKNALSDKGKMYIFEMILCEDSPCGGLLDMNMLVETGGGLRTRSKWDEILDRVNLKIIEEDALLPYLSMFVVDISND